MTRQGKISESSTSGTLQILKTLMRWMKYPPLDEKDYSDLLPEVDPRRISDSLNVLETSVSHAIQSVPKGNAVISFSGGIDSSILARLSSYLQGSVTLLCVGLADSPDLVSAIESSSGIVPSLPVVLKQIDKREIENAAREVSTTAEVSNLAHFEDCVAFWLICKKASELGQSVDSVITANGPDELFCGYDRFRRILDKEGYAAVEKEITKALSSAEQLELQVKRTTTRHGLTLYEPLMTPTFRQVALSIPPELKLLRGNDLLRKRIWRCLGRKLGLPETIVKKRKKAMQYGTGIHVVVSKMLKQGNLQLAFREREFEAYKRTGESV